MNPIDLQGQSSKIKFADKCEVVYFAFLLPLLTLFSLIIMDLTWKVFVKYSIVFCLSAEDFNIHHA